MLGTVPPFGTKTLKLQADLSAFASSATVGPCLGTPPSCHRSNPVTICFDHQLALECLQIVSELLPNECLAQTRRRPEDDSRQAKPRKETTPAYIYPFGTIQAGSQPLKSEPSSVAFLVLGSVFV